MPDLNINNLTLDDNSFKTIPDGDYHFIVESYEVTYATWDKVPPNTQQITVTMEIPYKGEMITITKDLYLCRKFMFVVRQFAESIGLVPEQGRANVDLTLMNGMEGICSVSTQESKNGNEYNRIETFYPPSKAPAVTLNDADYKNRDGFMNLGDSDVPFPT